MAELAYYDFLDGLSSAAELTGNERMAVSQSGDVFYLSVSDLMKYKGVVKKEFSLTSANILTLGSYYQIESAPGAGYMLDPFRAFYKLTAGGTPYDTNVSIQMHIGTTGTATVTSNTSVLGNTTDTIVRPTISGAFSVEVATVENQGLYLKCAGNPLNGNGTLKGYVLYQVIKL